MGLCGETRGFVKGIACAAYSSSTTEMEKKKKNKTKRNSLLIININLSFGKASVGSELGCL